MAILHNKALKRRPTHPGAMLREDFLPDYGLTVSMLAKRLGVSRQSVNELVLEHRAITTEMALLLSALFGNSPEFWLNGQRAVDLWDATQALKDRLKDIEPLPAA